MVKKMQDSSEAGVPHSYTVKIVKNRLPTTTKMVDEALIELHSVKGVTLKELVSFIAGKYIVTVTNQRKGLIKKRLNELRESGDLINKTGRGFNGHFKLANKKKFFSILQHNSIKNNSSSRKSSQEVRKTLTKKSSTVLEPKSPTTPTRKKPSMFDTPTTSFSELSTISADRLSVNDLRALYDTPVSSLQDKKRRRLI